MTSRIRSKVSEALIEFGEYGGDKLVHGSGGISPAQFSLIDQRHQAYFFVAALPI